MSATTNMEGLEGSMEGSFCHLGGLGCGRGRIGRIIKPTPQHTCALAHMCEYTYIILPILPSPYSMRSKCQNNPSKCLPHPSTLQNTGDILWSMERAAPGETSQRVSWHIAYLLAAPMDAVEVAELARLRRVQRWLAVAPERRAALRGVAIASAVVRMAGAITVMDVLEEPIPAVDDARRPSATSRRPSRRPPNRRRHERR